MKATPTPSHRPAAIIGMGSMFAKSPNLKAYWRTLLNGLDCISDPPQTHCRLNEIHDADPRKPDHIYCNRGGFLPSISFDPTEFGIPPAALEATDTSQLLGLVTAKMALEDAGYGSDREFDRHSTSVILGVTGTQELVIALGSRLGHPLWRKALENKGLSDDQKTAIVEEIAQGYVSWQENSFPGLLGNVVAGRISNRLDLGGTNCVVDAACASSLSALHLALMELAAGKSRMVVTGGVDTINDSFMHMCFSKTGVLSHSGDARPFSAKADGTVLGEGIGILVLKRLEDAEKDGDRIYAVIRGIGSSSDGKSQSIYAPRADGQARALRAAYAAAGIAPQTIGLIEAHGTGTRVGDEVEFTALRKVFGAQNRNGNRCALGSVKSMIGHTKAAAGAAGLIKAALSLHNKVLPPTLKANEPDPKLQLQSSPFYLNHTARPWFRGKHHPRRSGVSAFGFGGSNFHVVLEEYAQGKQEIAWDGAVEILAFSGQDAEALLKQLRAFGDSLSSGFDSLRIQHLAANARMAFQAGLPFRLALVVETAVEEQQLRRQLQAAVEAVSGKHSIEQPAQGLYFCCDASAPGKIAFLFPGQGSQYVNMGSELVCRFPVAMEAVETVGSRFDNPDKFFDTLYPRPAFSEEEQKEQESDLCQTDVAQPAIGAVSMAMLAVLAYFKLRPDATCGHSYGELPALFAAGWIDGFGLTELSIERGRCMAEAARGVDAGAMLAVKAPPESVESLIEGIPDIIVANINSPEQVVLSGTGPAIASAKALFADKGHRTVDLAVSAAFHSPQVAAAATPFARAVDEATLNPTAIPVIANATGLFYPTESSLAKAALGRQLISAVRFREAVANLYESGVRTFVEVGPKAVLSGLVQANLKNSDIVTIPLDRSSGKGSGMLDLAHAIGRLAVLGTGIDLTRWESVPPRKPPQRMSVSLSGANYRSPRKNSAISCSRIPVAAGPAQAPRTSVPASPSNPTKRIRNREAMKPRKKMPANAPVAPASFQPCAKTPSAGPHCDAALDVVHKGLASIQALQQQTAQAHQAFLETQAQASRTLQEMIISARLLTGQPTQPTQGSTAVNPMPSTTVHPAIPQAVQPKSREAAPPLSAHLPTTITAPQKAEPIDQPQPVADKGRASAAGNDVADTLIAVVAELTGYPEEMLGLEMDIASDLGIDSIKRVEILSAMEARMPQLPPVTPDKIGTLTTLGQICDFLAENRSADSPPPADQTAAETAAEGLPDVQQDAAAVQQTLIAVVAELTGYPEEMLGLEMDIASDLGIDSIKRVEILSAMEARMPQLPPVTPDKIGTLTTLGQICDFLNRAKSNPDPAPASVENVDHTKRTPLEPETIARQIVDVVPHPKRAQRELQLEPGRWLGILCEDATWAAALAAQMETRQIPTRCLKPEDVDRSSTFAQCAGLVIAWPIRPETAFIAAKHAAQDLFITARRTDALFATVTAMDGAFGFSGKPFSEPEQGALAGLAKTAALEWDSVICHAIDLAPDLAKPASAAQSVADELIGLTPQDPVEIGLQAGGRVVLQTTPALSAKGPVDLGQNDVVVITGGARGVTAACAIELARSTGASLALVGRSQPPVEPPSWLENAHGEAAMKRAIIENQFTTTPPTPKALEAEYRRQRANLEVKQTIDRIAVMGVPVTYCSADVADADALAKALDGVRKRFGPITGLIHGAGVLHDRLIVDKTVEQFSAVYRAKVQGLKHLLAATQTDPLRHLVLFSSVSARTGNTGQCDYAMANEVLNKMAHVESNRRDDCKVIAINWGPWDGGMVTPALKRALNGREVELIPVSTGARMMVAEMRSVAPGPVEVLIGSLLTTPAEAAAAGAKSPMVLLERRELDLNRYPVLSSHRIAGKPVVPFALITEWIGHGALKKNPGLCLHGIDDLRLLSGIRIDQEKKLVRLMAGKPQPSPHGLQVEVELRNGVKNGRDVIHSRAKALLVERLPDAPAFSAKQNNGNHAYTRDLEAIYGDILFHGDQLRAIQSIEAYSDQGMTARLTAAPEPEEWMQDPIQGRWTADPMVLDGAFQMAIVWCFEQRGAACLPSYARSYRQYRSAFPTTGVTAVMKVSGTTGKTITADYTFLDEENRVVATLAGYEAVVDKSLLQSFKQRAPQTAALEAGQ